MKGRQIHAFARIVAVADVFESATSDRAWIKRLSHEEGLAYIAQNRKTLFDPDVVDAFLECAAAENRLV